MRCRLSLSHAVPRMLVRLYLSLLLVVFVYPIIWTVMSSFKDDLEFNVSPTWAAPRTLRYDNYVRAWVVGNMDIFYKNSIIVTSATLALIVVLGLPAAFAIDVMKWKLNKTVLTVFLTGIMVPIPMLLIPVFVAFRRVGLTNSLAGLVLVYTALGLPLAVFFMSGYFKYLPREVIEAAVMDGCGIFSAFVRVVVPMSVNSIVTVLTLLFYSSWNELIFAMTLIYRQELKTIPFGLFSFERDFGGKQWGPIFASITMAILPTLVVYMLLSKFIIRGMTAGAVKQ